MTFDDLEVFVLGEMNMGLEDYLSLTLRSLSNKVKGFRKSQEDDFKLSWEQTRWLGWVQTAPFRKGHISVEQLQPFPWERTIVDRVPTKEELLEIAKAKKWV